MPDGLGHPPPSRGVMDLPNTTETAPRNGARVLCGLFRWLPVRGWLAFGEALHRALGIGLLRFVSAMLARHAFKLLKLAPGGFQSVSGRHRGNLLPRNSTDALARQGGAL